MGDLPNMIGKESPPLELPAVLDVLADLGRELDRLDRRSPAAPRRTPEELTAELELALPVEGRDPERLLKLLREIALATPATGSRRFFNQLFGGRDPAATLGELISVLLNVSMYTYKVAGPQILIEREVLARAGALVGFPDGEAAFVPGGSMANFVALLLARNEALPQARQEGLSGRRMAIYMSAGGHYSVTKNAGFLGLGREQVRKIPTDTAGRLKPGALEAAIERDLVEGVLPLAVVATAGTTVVGAFDPIPEIAEIARRHRLWLHVDGALGASVVLHPEHRRKMAGCEEADSVAWNPHKMMGMPLSCSMILLRKTGQLARHCGESADYLFQADGDELNPGTRSIQCGRRNDALKLWAAWQIHGDAGWAARIDRQLVLARYAAERIRAEPDLVLSLEPELINVCFEVRGKSSIEICDALHRRGLQLVGYGEVAGRQTIRLVTANPDLQQRDLDRFFDDLLGVAAELPPGENAVARTRSMPMSAPSVG